MYPRPTLVSSGALSIVLVALAVVIDEPLLLAGAIAVWGWIVAWQVTFAAELERTIDSLSVTRRLERAGVQAGDTVSVELTATLDQPSELRLTIDGGVPTVASAGNSRSATPLSVTLEPGAREATISRPIGWPISGEHDFDDPTVTAMDERFREVVPVDDPVTVTVTPRKGNDTHIGVGGKRIGTALGEHERGRLGSGAVPAEPREYVPGDTAGAIDWKTTARLGTTHVREYETETNHQTTLIVDHRTTLATGPAGSTQFDHVREVALSLAERAVSRGDPIGLVCIDDEGISTLIERTTEGAGYRTLRRRLLDLEVATERGIEAGPTHGDENGNGTPVGTQPNRRLTGDEARQRLADLVSTGSTTQTREDPFVETLAPLYESRASGTDRIAATSLSIGARAVRRAKHRRQRIAIFTDASRPSELRETVSVARERGTEVLVFLASSVLSEDGDVLERESAVERYREFERVRRDLAQMSDVSALEIDPPDRLASVCSAGGPRGDRT
ncbi:DUF58 domain-containing protein [Natrarchaeobius halalkaliphilus]|nr:DUF58 domain-containing protein [Natrarchaeobius halalkaliphilus]